MNEQVLRCNTFRQLHDSSGGWIIPNPWDVGSARILAGLGFKALATTSGGFAYTLGKADGEVTLDEMLEHCAALCAATPVPISADFENGYAEDLPTMTANIQRLAATGVAGISIEDFSRDTHSLYPITQATERVQAAVEAIRATGVPIMLTARAEGLLRGRDDLDEIVARLQAFEAAGADVLYAPAMKSLEQLRTVSANVTRPLNVLAPFLTGVSVQEMAAAGANRISVGGALTYATVAPLLQAGKEMLDHGTFNWVSSVARSADIRELMKP